MKKIIAFLIAFVTVVFSMNFVFAKDGKVEVYLEGFSGIDGEKINFDIPPQIINGRTMVPIRAIFEAMGATVNWDDSTKTAICTKDNTVVKMTLNSTTEYINDVPNTMDVAPIIMSGRILAPARYVAEAFGYNVGWDDMTKTVLISKNTNYTISDVVDGTREHPYKLGDTVSFDFWYYDEANGNCTLTLEEFLTPEEMAVKYGSNIFTVNSLSCIVGHIKLNEYSSSETCSEMLYQAEAVTSKLKPMGNYYWYNDFKTLSCGMLAFIPEEKQIVISRYIQINCLKGKLLIILQLLIAAERIMTTRRLSGIRSNEKIYFFGKNNISFVKHYKILP